MSVQPHTFYLGGFILTGEDEHGCLWTVAPEIQGWFTGGELRTATQTRSQQAGSYRGKTFTDGRIIVLRGLVRAPSTAELEMAGRRLSSLLRDGSFDQLVGTSEAGTFTSLVQMDATPLFTPLSDVAASWQIAVGSEDPLLYGPVWYDQTSLADSVVGSGRTWPRAWPRDWGLPPGDTPGLLTVPNEGLATYWPKFRLYGPAANPRIGVAETGDALTFNGSLAAGQYIDIDPKERRVTYGPNADPVRYLVDVDGRWPAIPPGGATLTYRADFANATSVLHVYGYEGAWD